MMRLSLRLPLRGLTVRKHRGPEPTELTVEQVQDDVLLTAGGVGLVIDRQTLMRALTIIADHVAPAPAKVQPISPRMAYSEPGRPPIAPGAAPGDGDTASRRKLSSRWGMSSRPDPAVRQAVDDGVVVPATFQPSLGQEDAA